MRLLPFGKSSSTMRNSVSLNHSPVPVSPKMKAKAVGMVGLAFLSGFMALAGIKHARLAQVRLEKERIEFQQRERESERKLEEDNARMLFKLEEEVRFEEMKKEIERMNDQMKKSSTNKVNRANQLESERKNNSVPISRADFGRVAQIDISKLESNANPKLRVVAKMSASEARFYLSKNYKTLAKSYRPLSVAQQQRNKQILEPLVRDAARRNGINADVLVKLVQQESRWDPFAINRLGDSGLTQLNPVLWDSRISTEYVCNPFNPVESIEVSAKYYRSLAEKFKDRRLALTAYNQGDSRVMGKLRRGLSADKIAASNPNNYYKKVESQKIN